jgi:cell division protein FtsQ
MSMNARMSAQPHLLPMDIRLMNLATWLLAIGIGVTALIWVTARALRHPVFAISRIVVEGDTSHHNELTLKANVGGRIHGNFFTLDLAQARSTFESVPWVRRATVRREFPNRLRVQIQEHRSMGFWGADSESRMVNSEGEVFEASAGDAETDTLPRLIGMDNQSAEVLKMHQLLSARLEKLDVTIETLELTGRGAWRMQLDGGGVIELGRGTQTEVLARLEQFFATQQRVLASYQRSGLDQLESADLRYPSGYAIRLRGVSTVAAAQAEKK